MAFFKPHHCQLSAICHLHVDKRLLIEVVTFIEEVTTFIVIDVATIVLASRFGKSTHISMISNSVTHLRSYANSAIADIAENSAPISPVTPRDRRRRRAERRRLRIERRYRRIE